MDPDPDVDPDPAFFVIDLEDANKKTKFYFKKVYLVENRIFAVSSPSTDARTGLYCCR